MPDAEAPITLLTPVEALPAVKPREAAILRSMGLKCVAHLLNHLPHRHEYEAAEAPVDQLAADQVISTRGEVTACRVVRRGKPRFEAALLDHTGRIDLVWFNQTFLASTIHPGVRLRVQGKAKRFGGRGGGLQLVNPRHQIIKDTAPEPAATDDRFRPVYPATEELPSTRIEKIIGGILDPGLALIEDHLPEAFRKDRELPELADAYRMMHAPRDEDDAKSARRRLAYDEFLLLQLGVHLRRAHLKRRHHAPALRWTTAIDQHIRARLPFALTAAQETVIREVAHDLTKETPANRLIQGDVGAGKTVIALYAMLIAVANKRQAALMAPTELLAEQHFASISRLLAGSDVRVELLTGSLGADERAAVLRRIESGDAHLAIGTHALLTESVSFADLAVAVIDEQHRFGVHQRAVLREKSSDPGAMPHTLVMTATPIPRTLSLTIFGDLDVSTLDSLPPGRKPVKTRLVTPLQRDEVYAFVRQKLDKGQQAFIVVPAVGGDAGASATGFEHAEDSGTGGAARLANVRSLLKELEEGSLAGKRLAAVHGQLKRSTRETIMERFRAGQVDALVATTVIEVGVDVPNATIMVIENADRFGLAQLHQLRGRIGRGKLGGVCVLISDPTTDESLTRLKAVVSTTDGFKLAETDFALRGPGDIFGGRQSGLAPFRVAELPKDTDLLLMARRDAAAWIDRSPELSNPDDTKVRSRLLKAHGKGLGLGDIA
ncbi:MAG: ATP-dependent DNA helicase RecG [Phycisphaerales bacterium]